MTRLPSVVVALLASVALAQELDGGVAPQDAGLPVALVASAPGDAGVARAMGPTFFEQNFRGTELLTHTPFLYEVGFVVGGGGLIHAPGAAVVPMTGVTVRERSGLLSAIIVGLFGNLLQTSSAVRIENVKRSVEVNGNTVTTTTTADVTVLKSQAQLEREQAELRRGVAGLTWMDLTVYADGFLGWDRGAPGGAGYEFSIGGHGDLFSLFGRPVVLDVGVQFANVRVPPPAGSGAGGPFLYYASGGLLGRLLVPLGRFGAASLEWVLNFLSLDYLFEDEATLRGEGRVVSSPLKLGIELYATDRVMLRAQAVLGGLGVTDGRLGAFLTAGVRL